MKNKKSITLYILIVIGVIILVNTISSHYFFRLDFTADKRFTLSKATKEILRAIDKPVTVTAYFTKDLPPQIQQTEDDFRDMLIEYSNIAKGNFFFEFVSPNDDEKVEKEIAKEGIAPQIINVREKDQAVQKKVYLAALLKYDNKTEVIPVILPGAAMEYSLSSSIKKLTASHKPLLGYIQGDGEPSQSTMSQAMKDLDILYDIQDVNLKESPSLQSYKSLIMVSPRDSMTSIEFQVLDNYLKNGGNVYIAMNRVDGNLNNASGTTLTTGLESWLQKKGITVENKFIVDASCGNVSVRQQQGVFSFTTQLSFPYLPLITNFSSHPAASGLESVIMQFASPVSYQGDSSLKFTPIAYTSNKTGTLDPPLFFDIQKKWDNTDFPESKLPVAAAVEGTFGGSADSKMVIIGDGDFAVNGQGQQARQINPDNVNLMVNSIDWLSDDTGLIQLRTKGITNRPLDQIEDGKKAFLKYLNFLLPIVLILIYGLFRSRQNKMKEIKRMQENYIE